MCFSLSGKAGLIRNHMWERRSSIEVRGSFAVNFSAGPSTTTEDRETPNHSGLDKSSGVLRIRERPSLNRSSCTYRERHHATPGCTYSLSPQSQGFNQRPVTGDIYIR